MRDIFKLGFVLLLYSLAAGAALGYVNIMTKTKIIDNKSVAENNARKDVLPGMQGGFDTKGDGTDFVYWTAYKDAAKSQIGGYIFIAKEKGYSSVVETIVGVDPEGKITGIKVLFQQETPGLGTKIIEVKHGDISPWFYSQFAGKKASDNIKVKKDGGDIEAITGATITPRAVTNSINAGLNKLKDATGAGS